MSKIKFDIQGDTLLRNLPAQDGQEKGVLIVKNLDNPVDRGIQLLDPSDVFVKLIDKGSEEVVHPDNLGLHQSIIPKINAETGLSEGHFSDSQLPPELVRLNSEGVVPESNGGLGRPITSPQDMRDLLGFTEYWEGGYYNEWSKITFIVDSNEALALLCSTTRHRDYPDIDFSHVWIAPGTYTVSGGIENTSAAIWGVGWVPVDVDPDSIPWDKAVKSIQGVGTLVGAKISGVPQVSGIKMVNKSIAIHMDSTSTNKYWLSLPRLIENVYLERPGATAEAVSGGSLNPCSDSSIPLRYSNIVINHTGDEGVRPNESFRLAEFNENMEVIISSGLGPSSGVNSSNTITNDKVITNLRLDYKGANSALYGHNNTLISNSRVSSITGSGISNCSLVRGCQVSEPSETLAKAYLNCYSIRSDSKFLPPNTNLNTYKVAQDALGGFNDYQVDLVVLPELDIDIEYSGVNNLRVKATIGAWTTRNNATAILKYSTKTKSRTVAISASDSAQVIDVSGLVARSDCQYGVTVEVLPGTASGITWKNSNLQTTLVKGPRLYYRSCVETVTSEDKDNGGYDEYYYDLKIENTNPNVTMPPKLKFTLQSGMDNPNGGGCYVDMYYSGCHNGDRDEAYFHTSRFNTFGNRWDSSASIMFEGYSNTYQGSNDTRVGGYFYD